jgi:hypothetical protein
MNIDTGLGVVIVAVLLFYLRLIVLQRQRAKQARRPIETATGKKRKGKESSPAPPNYSIISQKRRDRIVAGVGVVLILLGAIFYLNWLSWPLAHEYWWMPTTIGILAFSWLFRL